jgi:hypothetical protein
MTMLAALLLVIPLTSDDGWQVLSYRGIPAHEVGFSEAGVTIQVKRSAAPVIYPLASPMMVEAVRARGRIRGTLNVSPDRRGQTGSDDYALRLGLVQVGQRRPGFLERRFAPPWLRTLFGLAPPGAGISRVQFFNVGVSRAQLGQSRQHPSSELLHERIVAIPRTDGGFAFEVQLDSAVEVAAVWISADGDDTRSIFTLIVEGIELEGEMKQQG